MTDRALIVSAGSASLALLALGVGSAVRGHVQARRRRWHRRGWIL